MERHGMEFYIPLVWAQSAINIARKEGRIKEDIGAQKLFAVCIETIAIVNDVDGTDKYRNVLCVCESIVTVYCMDC